MIPKINIGSFNKYVFITCLKDVKKDFADYHFFHPMQKVNFTQFWDIFIIKGHLKWLTLLRQEGYRKVLTSSMSLDTLFYFN